jgi:hypothetical protein
MIIDNPNVMQEVIEETKPYFTHPGAEEIYTTKRHEMDDYAERFAELADRVWQNEYTNAQVEPEIQKTERSSFSRPLDGVQRNSREAA